MKCVKLQGNPSRFMNHSCDHNCVTETWSVNNETRIAFRTLKPIPKGTELTYDYQFISTERIECHCGAANCKRFLGNDAVKEVRKVSSS
jgi:SET domain-containing protein